MFIDDSLNYHILEKTSNEAFRASWIKISFDKSKNIICGIIYRQHNSPDRFQFYFDQSIENFTYFGKRVIIMVDFNIDLLKFETCSHSHDFLSSLQSCFLVHFIDKPTRFRSSSATLIDSIFVNTPNNITVFGNIIFDM